jgi:hypothetical protein
VSYVLKVRRSPKYSPRPRLLPEEDYLKVSPPTDQASELLDVLRIFVMADGTAYCVGRYLFPRYADVMCDKYISLGLFTARVEG